MSASVSYVVDDRDPSIEYLCPVVPETHIPNAYLHDSYTTIRGSQCGGGWFRHTFNGTSVRIFNHAKAGFDAAAVQLDISPMFKVTTITNGQYQSPTLRDGEHSITYAFGNQSLFPAFDFLTVTAGDSTQLRNKTIIVDDTDNAIRYSGNWTTEPSTSDSALAFDYSNQSYLNTTHWSNTVGDSITYSFQGTSVAVYGVIPASMSNKPTKNMIASYTIDNQETNSVSFPMSNVGRAIPMKKLLQVDSLSEGVHTLVMDITSIPDTSAAGLGLDFILYNASYDSLATMDATVPSSAGTPAGARVKSAVWQPIIGGVVGALALLLGICIAWLVWRKKQKAKAQAKLAASSKVAVLPTLKRTESYDLDDKARARTLTDEV
ncbi:hypothetical protein VNI00_002490 [Paramarasmius palmivorus]|uniref:Uncharacterized protein n=1 Tax=Paramarasmius palmivorus TaxID=297713 RepID=A0AAW0DZK4_9AGAR